jgi:hypothetical protein
METLIRLYYAHHNVEIFDPYLMTFLLMLGNHVIEKLRQPATSAHDAELYRSTLILCARGLHAQGKNAYVATMLYLMLRDSMETRDSALLQNYIHNEQGSNQDYITMYNQSNYPVPIIKINEDPRTVLLVDLVKAYETLSLDRDSPSTRSSTPEPC